MDWIDILGAGLTQALGPGVIVFALAAIGLNVQFGYTGLLNFGQAAFAAIGAYGLAIVVASIGLPFWVGVISGLLGGIVLAVLLGIPTLRLRADYLAIATIAAAEIIRRVMRASSLREHTGGSSGLRGYSGTFARMGESLGFERGDNFRLELFGSRLLFFTSSDLWLMTVGWIVVAAMLLLVWTLMRSPWGRVLRGIREDEEAVRSLGKNVFSYKIQALMVGGMIGAFAGLMQAVRFSNVSPDQYAPKFTFYIFAVLILGGAAKLFGPIVGAALFWGLYNLLDTFLRQLAATEVLPASVLTGPQVGPLVYVILGAGFIALLIFRPQGILGDKREMSLNVR
ncbi:MAG: branched-chain amino acid ABC transporter permease [Stackebrandtia sp.]